MLFSRQEVLQLLDKKGISYEIATHPAVYTMEEMNRLCLPYQENVAKNLFIRDDKKRQYYLLSVKGERKVDLKRLRQIIGSRPLSFASETDLRDLLHLRPGEVTPFGVLNDTACRVTVIIDRSFVGQKIGVHPADNTAMVYLEAADLSRLLEEFGHPVQWIDLDPSEISAQLLCETRNS
jgi:Ala-tRNA(Pro) deacylase